MREETRVPPTGPLDAEDRAIVAHLRRDGRASQRDVAAATGLSLATVNRRIHRLEETRVIRGYAAILDPDAVGWGLTTVIGLRIDKGHLRQVQESIARDPRVFAVYDVTGEWDGLVLARVRDRADLDDLAKGALSTPHIQRTNTMVVLATVLDGSLTDVPGLPQPRHKKT